MPSGASQDLIKSKKTYLYHPKTKEELKAVAQNLKVRLGDIDVSHITDMGALFKDSKRKDFSGIEEWNVSQVKNMKAMFADTELFNQPLDSWDVSRVKDMRYMFCGAKSFNQSLDSWNVSMAAEYMKGIFDSSGQKKFPKWFKGIKLS